MFTKIDIKKYGLYKDFTWGSLPELGRVNIIYGRNYSGKTTLSRIFDGISLGQLHKNYLDGEFTLHTEDDTVKTVTKDNMNDCPYPVRVYNSDYVDRNLSWLRNEEEGEIIPFTLLGSDNVEAQRDIDEIDEQLGSVEEKKGLLYTYEVKANEYKAKKQAFDDTANNLDNLLRNKANSDIKRKNYYVKQGATYNINNIQHDIDEVVTANNVVDEDTGEVTIKYTVDETAVLTDEVKEQLKKTIDESVKPTITALPEGEPHLTAYVEKVKELAPKTIALSKVLQELVENDLLQAWVDQGRELQKERTRCAFCGNPITAERWAALNAHFSKESEDLKSELTTLKEKLEKGGEALDDFLGSKGFVKENIYVSYQEEYAKVIALWNEFVENYKNGIGQLIAPIEVRLGNIFKPVNVEELKVEVAGYKEFKEAFNALVEKNNAYGLKLDGEKETARNKLRLDYVRSFCIDINYAPSKEWLAKEEVALDTMKTAVDALAAQIAEKKARRKKKELDKKDEGKAALKVTELLYNHFGNGSLSLEPETVEDEVDEESGEVKPRTRFAVKRGGVPAKNLSEGEKSLISFCYFIAQMADELNGPDAGNLVVFIDDPISSLDSSHIFFMYSLIESVFIKPTCFGQLFLSTHNLEFLRFTKRFKMNGPKGTNKICHYVTVKLGKGTTEDYRCEIKEMPYYLKKYMTEYNFLFEQIYDIAMLNSEEDQTLYAEKYTLYYNIGNNMRKFLECYLFNRYPNADEPLKMYLDRLFDDHVPSEVNRVVNEYSHLAWASRGMRVMDVPEVVTAAREILKALRTKDWAHYETLCKSVGKDETVVFS